MQVHLKIFRFNPGIDVAPYYKTYALPWTEGLTLLAAIRKIYASADPTLAFRNYFCGRGLCAGCHMNVNGAIKKACHVVLEPRMEYKVEPLKGHPIIRDLVVDFGIRRLPADSERHIQIRQGTTILPVDQTGPR
jgi:succinate dehydrogenase / fumarate reductase iron-sulfur subunit